MCEKLGISRCLIPQGAGVGSAIGFLKAPFGYEAVASKITRMSRFDAAGANALLADLRGTAEKFARSGASGELKTEIVAFMRYAGQGWEIPVPMPDRAFTAADAGFITQEFRRAYARFFGRAIDGLDSLEIEIVTWSVKVQDERPAPARHAITLGAATRPGVGSRPIFDPTTAAALASAVHERAALKPGDRIVGPAVIVESETATIVTKPFDAVIQGDGSILLIAREA